jgi:ParB-like chromosome segregation protein Spo0J
MNKRAHIDPAGVRNLEDHREVWILGQPPLGTYLDFIKKMALDDGARPPAELVDEWRNANDYFGELEVSEAGLVEKIEVRDLDRSLQPLADAVAADSRFQRAFDLLPWRFAMVELDKLIVAHPYLNESHKERIQQRVGDATDAERLFRFCQPLDRQEAPVSARAAGSHRFLFWSPSTDFRFQEAVLLEPEQAPGYQPIGAIGGLLALSVGYGSNFLSVIQSGNRMLLHNGHHRAYALHDLGITHAPCIVQTVSRLDELRLIASRSVSEDPEFYFAAKRPPLLRDFLDPKLRKVFRVRPSVNLIEVSFEVKEVKQMRDFADTE